MPLNYGINVSFNNNHGTTKKYFFSTEYHLIIKGPDIKMEISIWRYKEQG